MVKLLVLLLHTMEVTGPDLDIWYPDQGFYCFTQYFQASGMVTQIRSWQLPSTSFPIHYWLIILPFNVIHSELLTALQQTTHNLFTYRICNNNDRCVCFTGKIRWYWSSLKISEPQRTNMDVYCGMTMFK
jgi:hypothetical protein